MKHNYIMPLIVAIMAVVLIIFCVILATPAHAYEGDRITTARKGIGVELKPADLRRR